MARLGFDKLISIALLQRFEAEAMAERKDPRYCAFVLKDDNALVAHHPIGPSPDPAQMIWARDVLVVLNRELHHDGAWAVIFTDPMPVAFGNVLEPPKHVEYGRYGLIWIDGDGDPQFTQEWLNGENAGFKDFADVLLAGVHSTAQKCEGSWQTWKIAKQVADASPEQTFKRAQGQRAPSAVH